MKIKYCILGIILVFLCFLSYVVFFYTSKPIIVLDPTSPYSEHIRTEIVNVTYRGVPVHILDNLIQSESSWRYSVVNKSKYENSVGLAQINMNWFPYFKEKYGIKDPFNPYQSLNFAADYLKDLYEKTGSWEKAIIAYKAGLSKVDKAPAWVKKLAYKIVYGENKLP